MSAITRKVHLYSPVRVGRALWDATACGATPLVTTCIPEDVTCTKCLREAEKSTTTRHPLDAAQGAPK